MSQHPRRIVIEPQQGRGTTRRWNASFDGELIVERSEEPILDACRVLLGRGFTGPAEVWRPGKSHPDMRLDIEWGARRIVVEGAKSGPRFQRWRPHFRAPDAGGPFPALGNRVEADLEGGPLPP